MGLGERTARLHQTTASKTAGVSPEIYWDFKPGQKVMTVDGFPGVIASVEDGPVMGAETYLVVLANEMGGGQYTTSQLSSLSEVTASEIHTAADDYPELGNALVDHPDIAPNKVLAYRNDEETCSDCGGVGTVPSQGHEDPEDVDNGDVLCSTCGGGGTAPRGHQGSKIANGWASPTKTVDSRAGNPLFSNAPKRTSQVPACETCGAQHDPGLHDRPRSFCDTCQVPGHPTGAHNPSAYDTQPFRIGSRYTVYGVSNPHGIETFEGVEPSDGAEADVDEHNHLTWGGAAPACRDTDDYSMFGQNDAVEKHASQDYPCNCNKGGHTQDGHASWAENNNLDAWGDPKHQAYDGHGAWNCNNYDCVEHPQSMYPQEGHPQGMPGWMQHDTSPDRDQKHEIDKHFHETRSMDDADYLLGQQHQGPSHLSALSPQDQCPHTQGQNLHGQCKGCGYSAPTEGDEECDHEWCKGFPDGWHTKGEHIDPADRDPNSDASRNTEKSMHDAFGGEDHPLGFLLDQQHQGPSKYSVKGATPCPNCGQQQINGEHVMDRPGDTPGPCVSSEPRQVPPASPIGRPGQFPSRSASFDPWSILATAAVDSDFRFHVTAAWSDVRKKAQRIMKEGGVHVTLATKGMVIAEVQGDHNTYESGLQRYPGRQGIAAWSCGCKWGAYHWGAADDFSKFAGRMCSHALALQYEAQSQGMFGKEVSVDSVKPRWVPRRGPVVKYDIDPDVHVRAPGSSIPTSASKTAAATFVRHALAQGDDVGEVTLAMHTSGFGLPAIQAAVNDAWGEPGPPEAKQIPGPTKPPDLNENPASVGWASGADPASWQQDGAAGVNHMVSSLHDSLDFEADLHDSPEPALPTTDSGSLGEAGDIGSPASLEPESLGFVSTGSVDDMVAQFQASAGAQALNKSTPAADGMDIAAAAKEHLAKESLKAFTPSEQYQIINEGADTKAANLDRLNLTGTHYVALEKALSAVDDDEESWLS